MKNRMCLIVSLASGLMLSGGAAFAQDPVPEKASTPEMVEGEVTQVDMNQGKLTIRASDGTTHVFEASKETLEGYKVGDPVKAKLRTAPQ